MKSLYRLSTVTLCWVLAVLGGCELGQGEQDMLIETGVSAVLAKARAERISNLSYRLEFSVPDAPEAPLEGRVLIKFELSTADSPLLIDFAQPAKHVLATTAQGLAISPLVSNEHILVPASALQSGPNAIDIRFIASQDAVNRNPDYLFTLFVPDRARRAFPLFDQPDLKARYSLSLETPMTWTTLSNASMISSTRDGDRQTFRFAATDPLPSYLFSFVAGEFDTVERTVGGRQMTMLHRETDTDKLARNLDAIFTLHQESLDWLEDYTAIDYPFEKFAFALIPDFPYGGMEHVGAIQYRSSSLLLEASPSENQRLNRAQLIAHETAHMWFGNLVTMRWFDDVWTKEVFANFMADKIVNPQFPDTDHELNFLVSHYPQAYGVDRTEGANPIRQRLDNLNLAGQLYGPIIYHKAPIMMRQLELLLGEAAFQRGLQTYLSSYAYGNATWPALIALLDKETDIDLAGWSEVWVNTAGMPHFALTQTSPDAGSNGGDATPWTLQQIDPAGAEREWPQQFSLWSRADATEVDLRAAEIVALPAALRGSLQADLLFNANGLGYGHFPVDTALFDAWEELNALQRGVLMMSSFENLISPPYGSTEDYFDILLTILVAETNELLIELAGQQLYYVYFSLLGEDERAQQMLCLEDSLWQTLLDQCSDSMTKVFFELYSSMALSDGALENIYDVWSGRVLNEQLSLQEAERIRLAELLAVRLPDRADAILAKQRLETVNPDRLRRLDFISPALAKDPAVRDAFFDSLKHPENRATEVWVSNALARLNDPSRLDHASRYLLPSLELLEEIQVTGDIFFPSAWLNRSLGPHASLEAANSVRQFLSERPDYNPQLRMKILQAADPLFRASAMRNRDD